MTIYNLQNIQVHLAKIAVLFLVVLVPFEFAHANVNDELALELEQQITALLLEQVINDKDNTSVANTVSVSPKVTSCRNTQIISYTPVSGSNQSSLSEFIFNVKDTTKIASLELSINGRNYPVQYTQNTDGSYRARVVNLDNLQGNLYITMGAQSESTSTCNDLLYTSFSVKKEQKQVTPTEAKKTNNITPSVSIDSNNTSTQKVADTKPVNNEVKKPNTISITKLDEEALVGINDDKEVSTEREDRSASWWPWSWFGSSEENSLALNTTDSISSSSSATVDEEVDSEITASSSDSLALTASSSASSTVASLSEGVDAAQVKAAQAALLFGLINKDVEKCSTVGALWSWYVWLGIIWLWLIAVWVAISFYAEPVFGTASYSRRLTYIMLASAFVGIGIWYLTNPCFTHAWLPATFVGLSILLHWLYSEDAQ